MAKKKVKKNVLFVFAALIFIAGAIALYFVNFFTYKGSITGTTGVNGFSFAFAMFPLFGDASNSDISSIIKTLNSAYRELTLTTAIFTFLGLLSLACALVLLVLDFLGFKTLNLGKLVAVLSTLLLIVVAILFIVLASKSNSDGSFSIGGISASYSTLAFLPAISSLIGSGCLYANKFLK